MSGTAVLLGLVFLLSSATALLSNDEFDPIADARILHDSVHFFTTDTETIIQLLSSRTHEQRVEINLQYRNMFEKNFAEGFFLIFNFDVYGNFISLLKFIMKPTAEVHAEFLRLSQSMYNFCDNTERCTARYNFDWLASTIMVTATNSEILKIDDAFKSMYGNALEYYLTVTNEKISNVEDVYETRYDYRAEHTRLLLALSKADRDETSMVHRTAARFEALRLFEAGENSWSTDESIFISTFVKINLAQLNQIFLEYQNITGHDIEIAVKNEFSGGIKFGLLSIVEWVRKGSAEFFADMFFSAMDGPGTKDNELIWLVATRSKNEIRDIKTAFLQKYGESLENMISSDTSGDFKDLLLAVIK